MLKYKNWYIHAQPGDDVFTQRISPNQRQQIVYGFVTVLRNNPPHGIKLFARENQIASSLAESIINVASRQEADTFYSFSYGDAASIAVPLKLSTRAERLTAQRTLAKIIQDEIKGRRIIPVYTHASRMYDGEVDIPEYALMTSLQFAAMQAR